MDEKNNQIHNEDSGKDIPLSPDSLLEGEAGEGGTPSAFPEGNVEGDMEGDMEGEEPQAPPGETGIPREGEGEDFPEEGVPEVESSGEGLPEDASPEDTFPEDVFPEETLLEGTAPAEDLFFTKEFAAYTVTEGLLLLVFLILLIRFCIEMTQKLLHWRSF